jgi:hypothetical protein
MYQNFKEKECRLPMQEKAHLSWCDELVKFTPFMLAIIVKINLGLPLMKTLF